MAKQVIEGNTKNFGTVAAIVFSTRPPKNQKILWYDEASTANCPIKFYNKNTGSWESLKD